MDRAGSLHLRYRDVAPLRESVAFRILAARRLADERRCVLVTPLPGGDAEGRRRALARAAAAHARIQHPAVPRTTELLEIDDRPVLELDCPAVADAVELYRRIVQSGVRVPVGAADGFIVGLRKAMQAAHAHADENGGPLCLGRLSQANVLFDAEGRSYLVGWGHNFPLDDEAGRPDPRLPHSVALDVALGGSKTPTGDYVALLSFLRSNLALVDRGDFLARIMHGLASNTDKPLIDLVVWVEQRVISGTPQTRPTIEEGIAVANRIRAMLGFEPDAETFARIAGSLLRDADMDEGLPARGSALLVGPDAEWVRFRNEPPRKLRGPMRRVLLALSEKQLLGSDKPVRSVDLAEIGWPDETAIEHESALNRVYVTMNRLRKVLPEGVLERYDDGYRLRPDVSVHRVGAH